MYVLNKEKCIDTTLPRLKKPKDASGVELSDFENF